MARALRRGVGKAPAAAGHLRGGPRRAVPPRGRDPREIAAAWGFPRSGAVTVLPITDEDLPAIEALREKYRDRPMDFADATLVHLAGREDLTTVFTIDHDDFETYRVGGRRQFLIVPGR